MLITGARVARNATAAERIDLFLRNDRVFFVPEACCESPPAFHVNLTGFLILPGLINVHDHLELNLFPRLGNGPYPNATAWAEDIYRPQEAPLQQLLAVPKPLRLTWGALKNLFSGVTTVAHHNAAYPLLFHRDFPIRVVQHYGWAHSLRFSPDWRIRFRETPRFFPFIMHAAEGTDDAAREEIEVIDRAGALGPSTVLIHGVGMGASELALVSNRGSSLVWCPTSNHFTLGRTVSEDVLQSNVPVALGTDSSLTARGDLWDELHTAGEMVDTDRLYAMVTTNPARMLKLRAGFGEICDGGPADLVVLPDMGQTPAESLLNSHPEMVLVRGQVALASDNFRELASWAHPVQIEGRGRYFVSYPVERLVSETRATFDGELRLAGKAIVV